MRKREDRTVNIISLPQTLPGELDLANINLHLHLGEATLDWSQVQEASEDQLAVLLADLDLVEQSDVLGIDTIPDHLSHSVLHTLSDQQNTPYLAHHQRTLPAHDETTPFVWTPEENADRPTAAPQDETTSQLVAKHVLKDSPHSILQPLSPSALRDELERLVLQDLLGPAGGPEEEVDEGSVRDRYLVGALAPRDQQLQPEEMDELAIPEEGSVEDGANDDAALHIASLYPSSIGMSFSVDGTATSLSVEAGWGYYRREHSETIKTPKGAPKMVWKRQQISGKSNSVPLKEGPIPSWSPEAEEQPDVVVRGLIRRSEDSWTVTLFLVNEQREPEKRRDEAWVFQPELFVAAPDGAPIFQRRSTIGRRQSDEELAMSMLYRRHMSFAIGHGVGVHAETVADEPTRAVRLTTRVVPTYDVPRTEAPTTLEIPGLTDLVLDMQELAECSMAALANRLMPLATCYATWIAEQTARIDDPEAGLTAYRRVAEQAMEECRRTLVRIEEGITLLSNNRHAAQAFSFMNRAMWLQRIHTLYAEERRTRAEHIAGGKRSDQRTAAGVLSNWLLFCSTCPR